MGLVRFYAAVVWLGITLAALGQLKSCTQIMMGLAADKTKTGIISYSQFSHLLTR